MKGSKNAIDEQYYENGNENYFKNHFLPPILNKSSKMINPLINFWPLFFEYSVYIVFVGISLYAIPFLDT